MRLSSRLIANALSSYLRLGVTFLIGIFLTWYLLGEIGLVGLGMISLATGTVSLSGTENAIRQSIVRELAAALASADRGRIERVLASAGALGACAALLMLILFLAVAALAWLGMFRTGDAPGLRGALAWLFAVEGAVIAIGVLLAPWTQAVYAAQRVGIDNLFMILQRLAAAAAAVLAFSVLWPEGALAGRVAGYGAVRLFFAAAETVLEAAAARWLVPALRLRRGAFDAAEFRAIGATAWHTWQVTLGAAAGLGGTAVVLNLFFGLTYNGLWQIVGQVGGHIRMIGLGLLRGIDPISTHLEAGGRREAVLDLMVRGVRYQLLAVLPVAALYLLFMTPIIRLWIGERLVDDEHLAAAGITAAAALSLTVFMASLNVLSEVFRMSTRGVERILFGIGEVRAYAWFAKWGALLTLLGAAAILWIFRTPAVAPVPLLVVNFVSCVLVVPLAAARRAGLSLAQVIRRSLPRPIVLTLLLLGPFAIVRALLPELTVASLAALLLAAAAVALPLTCLVGFDGRERARALEIMRRLARRG